MTLDAGPDRLNPRQGSETGMSNNHRFWGLEYPDRLNPRQGSETNTNRNRLKPIPSPDRLNPRQGSET